MNVALSHDSQVPNDIDGRGSKHVVILVRQSLGRSHNDGVTSVDTERVKVLHVADSNAVVCSITNDLILDLLPALERLFDQNL